MLINRFIFNFLNNINERIKTIQLHIKFITELLKNKVINKNLKNIYSTVQKYQDRMKAVIKAKGYHTKY